jgi:proteasome lid subunit RPN8/RPN11
VAAVPSSNIARSPVRYRLDDRLHIDVRRVLRRLRPELEILGVYHSHPIGPVTPSPTDIREANYPSWVYVILGFSRAGAPRMHAFEIQNGTPRRIHIRAAVPPQP